MHRSARQNKILEIIGRMEIETQEELCNELNKLNFNVTQATISRDIKELKLYKVAGNAKKYKYAYIEGEGDAVSNKMRNLFRECVQSINYANNLIIVKTMRGNAGSAGTFIDSLQIQEVIGCVAGDDTLMLVVDSNEHTPTIVDRLREYIL